MERRVIKAIVLILGLLIFLAACSSYSAKESPVPQPKAMPYVQTEAMMVVGVDPYVQPDKVKALFGEDLLAANIIPLQIAVSNQGERQARVEARNFRLELPGGEVAAPRPASEVAALFDARGSILDHASTGIGWLGRLGGTIGGLVANVVGGLVSGSVQGSQKNASSARRQDYTQKELKGATLGRNESIRGFLFFSPPGTAALDEATLILDIYETDTITTSLKVPLKNLGYKASK